MLFSKKEKKVVSFLASGRGSNFEVVARAIKSGKIKHAELGILISDKPEAKALELAKTYGMKSYFVNPKAFPDKLTYENEMIRLFDIAGTELIVAAGYMRILSPHFVRAYRYKLLNIHPALLPSFTGAHAQLQALNHGVKITGCTTHFIDEGVDSGPIILQSAVFIENDDTEVTLSKRILAKEHEILPETVALFCADRLKIEGRRVLIIK